MRAGGALALAFKGSSLREIMAQGLWSSPSTAMQYIGILKEMIGVEFLEEVQRRHAGLLPSIPSGDCAAIPRL